VALLAVINTLFKGILFKFAKDYEFKDGTWLYGGKNEDESLAAKSAGQELLSANYVGSYDPLIKVPLMAIVDYWGRRLIATAFLPIDEISLVYGSADGGKKIVSKGLKVNKRLADLGEFLNLQKHDVNKVSMALCGDMEVHQCDLEGEEKQYYCLDTATCFPSRIT